MKSLTSLFKSLFAFVCSSLLRRGSRVLDANSELIRSQIEAEAGRDRTRRAIYCSSGQLAPLASHRCRVPFSCTTATSSRCTSAAAVSVPGAAGVVGVRAAAAAASR